VSSAIGVEAEAPSLDWSGITDPFFHRTPQRLHKVPDPLGPRRHMGVVRVLQ
jgi:hypothetical protein